MENLALAVQQVLPIGSIVKKSNSLIRTKVLLTNGTVNHNRIIAALISTIKTGDNDFNNVHVIHIKSIMAEQKGVNYYKSIKKICGEIADTKAEIEGIDKDGKQCFGFYPFFISIEYRDGYVQARFSPLLKPYLLQLREKFTEYYLIEYLSLSSIYSQRLYEVLMSWSGIQNKPIKIDINELHNLLNTPESLRDNYKNFRIKVLDTALKQITTKTELRFTYRPIKKGGENCKTGKVYAIEFVITNAAKIKHTGEEQQQIVEQNLQHVQSKFDEVKQHVEKIEEINATMHKGEDANIWFDLINKNPDGFILPPVPDVWLQISNILQQQDEKSFNTWFGQDDFTPFIDKNGVLILDFTKYNNTGTNFDYIITHFDKKIKDAIQLISPGLQYKITEDVIHRLKYEYVMSQKTAEQHQSESILDQVKKEPLKGQFELLKGFYPRKSDNYNGAYKVFCMLHQQKQLPTFYELVMLISKSKETHEWRKSDGKYIPGLKKWLESKPWATIASEEYHRRED